MSLCGVLRRRHPSSHKGEIKSMVKPGDSLSAGQRHVKSAGKRKKKAFRFLMVGARSNAGTHILVPTVEGEKLADFII